MRDFLRLVALMRSHRWTMALAILLALLATLANIGLMAVSGWFIAAMGLAGAAGLSMNYFTPAAVIRALAMTRTGGRYAERVVSHEATFQILAGLRRWFYDRLEPLAPGHLAAHASGDLLARIRNDIERLELVFLRILSPVAVALLTAVVVVSVLALYHRGVALAVFLLLLVAGTVLPYLAARNGADPSLGLARASAAMKETLVDGLEGLAVLKVAGGEAAFSARMARLGEAHAGDEARLARLQGLSLAGTGLVANIALLAVLVLAIPTARGGSLQLPELPMLMLLAVASFDAVAPLPLAFQSISGALASARRVFELVDRAPAIEESSTLEKMPDSHRLRFEAVSFRYAPGLPLVLEGIDLDLAEHSRIAIVGESGSGKSTLVHLAVRFSDPCQGRVTLDGVSLDRLAVTKLRSRFAVVPQNAHLFAATVRDNLLIARPGAVQGQIEAAARAAQIHETIAALPQGYDTFVGAHGALLSGGEARRVAVARALLREAPILLLDEPTEGLDPETARDLMASILDFARDRSILLVTHHRAGLEFMDEIVVLTKGRISSRGSYEEFSGSDALLVQRT